AREQLTEKVDSLLKNIKNDQDRIVYIKSGVGVSYGDVVNVINEVRKIGVDKIGLVADKKKKGAAAVAPAATERNKRRKSRWRWIIRIQKGAVPQPSHIST